MNSVIIPEGYRSLLGLYDTQNAIGLLKRLFEDMLSGNLHLQRVSAPLFVNAATGLNDDLSGVERAVSFDIPATGGMGQVVHSLAKWKRLALHTYGFQNGNGLVTDMNAIRRDEDIDNLHSIYVDQWDWEKIMMPDQRNIEFLKETVRNIIAAVCDAQQTLKAVFPTLCEVSDICREVTFVTTQELEDKYPSLTAKEREQAVTKEFGTVFLIGIGGALDSGKPHDGRAPDYDDWTLNGDILCWHEALGVAVEISSMGIRVDAAAMERQLAVAGCLERKEFPFHKMLLAGELPQTIGGGIGQSRLCMLMLGAVHIGEVQASLWDEATMKACADAGVSLL